MVESDGTIVPLAMAIEPEAIDRGMQVEVAGAQLDDGSIEPQTIAITALAPAEEDAGKTTLKAARTDNLLVILMRFTDSPAQPFTQAQVQAVVDGGPGSGSVAEYFKEASFGQQLVNATVTPWLSTGSATSANCDWRTMGTLGRNAATAAGYSLSSYQKVAYVFPRVASCGWLGLGYVGGSGVWINGANTTLVFGHELGHNFGLLHAGSVDCGANVIGGTCSASEYGDPFGIMGNQTRMHVNAYHKAALGWIASTTTDRIRIHVTRGLSGYSRITEVEAWSGTTATSNNVALASSGAVASASSSSGACCAANATIDGERSGIDWGSGGGWRDGTFGAWPDWLQVNRREQDDRSRGRLFASG